MKIEVSKTIHPLESGIRCQLSTLEVKIPNLPKAFHKYTIVQLTDLHFGPITPLSHIKQILSRTRSFSPDLIVFTGDYIQVGAVGFRALFARYISPKIVNWTGYRRRVRAFAKELAEELNSLTAKDGIFGIFGNHEYHEGWRTIERYLGKQINWLHNKSKNIERENEQIRVSGLDDIRYGKPNLSQALSPPAEKPWFHLLLCHNPDIVLHQDAGLLQEADLVLCGHTHGGQIQVPGLGPIITRTKQKDYTHGLGYLDSSAIYVSNGAGYGTIRLRLFCPPEITLIKLVTA